MIACPECGAEQYPGALFCDTCGAAIHPAVRVYPTTGGLPSTGGNDEPAARMKVSSKTPPPAETTPTAAPAIPPPATAPDPPALRARLPHHNAELTLHGALIHVGRADPETGFTPELDLTPFGGQERGVSRRHATIQWVEGGYVIVDRHSSNGTWLDGVRLVAGYAYQIPPGAAIRFGGLLVQLAIAD